MDVYADLHVHTTNSDGTLPLGDVPSAGRTAGVSVVAITDHDRYHPDLTSPVARVDDITVIHGIELKVQADERIDLLGYGLEPTGPLIEEVERLQRDRRRRGAAIIECVEEQLDIDLSLEPRAGLGRPHIARAIADHPEAPYDVQGAFDHLIGDDGPCYVPRELSDFERGRDLLSEACAFVGLAHPLRYDDPSAALELTSDLDAVERWYPYESSRDPTIVDRAIEEHDLIPTGGSDAHDDQLGRAGLSKSAYRRARERLPDPAG